MLKPSTNPTAAISLMSPPPVPPQIRAASKNGSAAKIPHRFAGWKTRNPVKATPRQRVSGMIRFRISQKEAAASRAVKKPPCKRSGSLISIIEHVLDPLFQGRKNRFPEQGIEAGQDQSADDNGDQNFNGGVHKAFTALGREQILSHNGFFRDLRAYLIDEFFHRYLPPKI
ncbi:hypothetical protein DSY4566 [Desulfitobacterium hafniense Y51]|uniref:Uncharacterized protein n=1 Tax=Desulfitobacterium hafniense (strain Y51) TaxID=138119 RepID=Q24NN7_DESHY|nr:hypothetical protein DSY4566 [Desulfitobacterium hafniense Y51]